MECRDSKIDGALTAPPPPLAEWLESYPKLGEALRTCALRFVINLPEEMLRNAARLCFELQEAQWFYVDYLYENAKKELPKLNQANFCHLMVEFSDVLRELYGSPKDRQRLLLDWRDCLRHVPLKGAVMLNERLDKCLMVQPWKGDKWTFPRGKINEGEGEGECAVREVWEETGIDIAGLVDTSQFVSADLYGSGCPVKLFLVPGIPEETHCAPNTRKEISKIGWIPVSRFPNWDAPSSEEGGVVRFFCVEPFVHAIKKWVKAQKAGPATPVARPEAKPAARLPIGAAPTAATNGASAATNGVEVDVPQVLEAWSVPQKLPRKTSAPATNGLHKGPPQTFSLDVKAVLGAFDKGWDNGTKLKASRPSR